MSYENGNEYETIRKLTLRYIRISDIAAKQAPTLEEKMEILEIRDTFRKFDSFLKLKGYAINEIEATNINVEYCECGALL
jgi:hypothetical protein